MKYVVFDKGCWLWCGGVAKNGYGRFWFDGETVSAHRASYIIHKGSIEDNLTIDHLCRVRRCVNPDHLEAVTIGDNWRRATVLITHCPKGHEYNEKNTYIGKKGDRQCRVCRNESQKRYLEKRRNES
jgi:hypothetical protein